MMVTTVRPCTAIILLLLLLLVMFLESLVYL
jgi:hypothetical protein